MARLFLRELVLSLAFREGLAATLTDGKSSRVLAAFAASLAEWPIGHSDNEKFCSSPNHPEGCIMSESLLSQQRNSTTSKLNTIVGRQTLSRALDLAEGGGCDW
jgi:hypothetical protein